MLHFILFSLHFGFYFSKRNGVVLKISNYWQWHLLVPFYLGIAIELMQQYFTTTRSADVFDVLANTTGALLAIISILILNKITGIVDKI